MITTHLMGGMGNQMFQYAFGLAQATRYNTSLQLDVSSFVKDPLRQYSLNLWEGVTEPICTNSRPTVYEGHQLLYNSRLEETIKDGDALCGYWQTEKYFLRVREELLRRFHTKNQMSDHGFEVLKDILRVGERSSFLTIRRSDYLLPERVVYHGVLPQEYYQAACQEIASHVENPVFFVFSDEPEWCKKNLNLAGHDWRVVGSHNQTSNKYLGREDEDLWLMSRCRHAIMANSSFSWWGAWMSPYEFSDRIVIGPKNWFNKASISSQDIMPDRWIKI